MKKKKIFCLFLGAAAVLLTGSLLALAEKTGSAEELQEGQRIARIRVVSIVGNELTYYEIEEESEEATTEETEEETEKQTEETADLSESERIQESETEGAAEDNSEGETEGSGGDFPAGELPDDFSQEELPGGEFPQGESGEFPGGEFPQGESGDFPGRSFRGRARRRLLRRKYPRKRLRKNRRCPPPRRLQRHFLWKTPGKTAVSYSPVERPQYLVVEKIEP